VLTVGLTNGDLFIISFFIIALVFLILKTSKRNEEKKVSTLYNYEKGVESIPYNSLKSGVYVLETMQEDKLLFMIDEKLNILNLTEEKTNSNLNIISFKLSESFNILSVERVEKGLNSSGEFSNNSELQLIKTLYLFN